MTEMQKISHLTAGEYVLSRSETELWLLRKGQVKVYLLRVENGRPGNPVLYCQMQEGDMDSSIPCLLYRESETVTWHTMILACGDGAALEKSPNRPTSVLHKKFLKKQAIQTYAELGFEKSLVEFASGRKPILLTGADKYLTEVPGNAYYLERGHVFVFIVPLKDGKPEKPLHYCDVYASDPEERRYIPALAFRDEDHRNWRLEIKPAGDDVALSEIPGGAGEAVYRDFLSRRNITTFDMEGFENSLAQFYKKQVDVKDQGFIVKQEKLTAEVDEKIVESVKDAFSEVGRIEHTDSNWYQALQFVCKRSGIFLIGAEDLYARCGQKPGVEEIARASHFICRKIVLDAGWYKQDCGGFVGKLDKEIIGCIPDRKGRYLLFRSSDESITPLTPELAEQISPQAYSLGRTLPLKPLKKKDVVSFCCKSIHFRDLTPYIILVIACSLIGVLLPTLNGMIYDDYIPVGDIGNLIQLCLVLLTFMGGNVAFSIVKNLFGYRMTSRVDNDLQNAVYHRLFHLPESFFRAYDSADLAQRASEIGSTASGYANTLIVSSISALFSVFYLIRMFKYNTKLTWLSVAIYAVYILISASITSSAHKGERRIAEAESEASSKLYQYLNGVDKIRMAGVEEKALQSYLKPYSQKQYESIRVNRLVSVEEALSTVVKSIFSMVLYWYIVKKLKVDTLSVGTFVAFNSAFGAFTGALDSFVDEALNLFRQRSEIKRFWPIFDAVPEDDDDKQMPGELRGDLTLKNVCFAYDKGGKQILNNLSLKIKEGEYIGIVGPSGCGKSTLLKLLLGFETPQSGTVMVGDQDLRKLNKGAYRRQLGVVLQNGRLISGSIYENITITAPDATMARVNEVVEKVGLKEDIAQMPMGLHTMLSESSNTISGGQQQRILIARAICGKPKILLFDEATSALDNMTQAAVSKSLDELKVTRIVVAHRLSTIKNCSRILVMQEGKVIQEGNYETLMRDKEGLFYALASRQIAQ